MSSTIFTAEHIASLLTEPGKPVPTPTLEQQKVIEHPLGEAVLVVAGAGSGKTETMSNRVIWLVANDLAQPEEILGLTFTRKAAGELAERVQRRLLTFVELASAAAMRGELNSLQKQRIALLRHKLDNSMELPEVSTYNSFAVGVVQEFGAGAGISSEMSLIDEATAWNLAREVIIGSDDPELYEQDLGVSQLIEYVLKLDREVHEHLTSFNRVAVETTRFLRVTDLPYNDKTLQTGAHGKVYSDVTSFAAGVGKTALIARLAKKFAAEKRHRGLLEFSDQVSLALETIRHSPTAKMILCRRNPVVLLDEVQDTSVGQTKLLSEVYAGNSVMAVGDPHQSIYGWRGASSASLSGFHRAFNKPSVTPVTLTLSTSWRNAKIILEAANHLAAPLRAETAIHVPELRARPGATEGTLSASYHETIDDEREHIAGWVLNQRETYIQQHGTPPTISVIFRQRKYMGPIAAALTSLGVPNQIIGLGGLLSTPEVIDIVSTLRCLWYADAGNELVRILNGPRFAIGVADIQSLQYLGRWFNGRDHTQHRVDEAELADLGVLELSDNRLTLLDALDKVPEVASTHPACRSMTELGHTRLKEAALMLRELRGLIGSGIPDLIRAIEYELRLDIELEAHEMPRVAERSSARANIDTFVEVVSNFLAVDGQSTLRSVLQWLERSEQDDSFNEHVPPAQPGTVQLITAHSAKGLEWDIVAVPHLTGQDFPASPRSLRGWLSSGSLPDSCRGDAATRPELRWELASTQKDLLERVGAYRDELREVFAAEERRLIYVAVTRAKTCLLLTGFYWSDRKKQSVPSEYLEELAEAGMIDGVATKSLFIERPVTHSETILTWPLDPLGTRRDQVTRAGAEVHNLMRGEPENAVEPFKNIDPTVKLLLQERQQLESQSLKPALLGSRINASVFHEYISNPDKAILNSMRPVPSQPYRGTRIGNLFHEWVETRTTTPIGTMRSLEGFEEARQVLSAQDQQHLDMLIDNFERSRWAPLQPLEVELEISMPFADRRVVCKLDAVFEREGRREIVDWKTGRPPLSNAERQERLFQLDIYRLAYARYAGLTPTSIDVSLFYVRDNIEIAGEEFRDLQELESLWQKSLKEVHTVDESLHLGR